MFSKMSKESSNVPKSILIVQLISTLVNSKLAVLSFLLHNWYIKGRGMCYPVCGAYKRTLMVQWVIRYIHSWCNRGHDMCYPVCEMVHIKEPLLLVRSSPYCGGSRLPL